MKKTKFKSYKRLKRGLKKIEPKKKPQTLAWWDELDRVDKVFAKIFKDLDFKFICPIDESVTMQASFTELIEILESDLKKLKDEQ